MVPTTPDTVSFADTRKVLWKNGQKSLTSTHSHCLITNTKCLEYIGRDS